MRLLDQPIKTAVKGSELTVDTTNSHTSEEKAPSGARLMFGDFAPALVDFTDNVLFGQVWPRTGLSPKERSLVTVAALTTSGNVEQLNYHLRFAVENGNTPAELIETITHLAFYAGWPKAMSALGVAKQLFDDHVTAAPSKS